MALLPAMQATGLKPCLSGTAVLLRMWFRFGLLASAKKIFDNRKRSGFFCTALDLVGINTVC
jgi:hypothetical protein